MIEILLVPESEDREAREIEDDVQKEFNERNLVVPWSNTVEKIKVLEIH